MFGFQWEAWFKKCTLIITGKHVVNEVANIIHSEQSLGQSPGIFVHGKTSLIRRLSSYVVSTMKVETRTVEEQCRVQRKVYYSGNVQFSLTELIEVRGFVILGRNVPRSYEKRGRLNFLYLVMVDTIRSLRRVFL